MSRNRIRLNICGAEFALTSDDSESYIHAIAEEVEAGITEMVEKNPHISITTAGIISALNYCDAQHKAEDAADNLRSQIKDYLEDSSQVRMEADEARRENEKLKKEVQTLRSRLEHQAAEPKKSAQVPGRTVAAPAPISRPAGQNRAYSQPAPEQKEKSTLDQEIMEFFQSGEAEE